MWGCGLADDGCIGVMDTLSAYARENVFVDYRRGEKVMQGWSHCPCSCAGAEVPFHVPVLISYAFVRVEKRCRVDRSGVTVQRERIYS